MSCGEKRQAESEMSRASEETDIKDEQARGEFCGILWPGHARTCPPSSKYAHYLSITTLLSNEATVPLSLRQRHVEWIVSVVKVCPSLCLCYILSDKFRVGYMDT